MLYNQPVGEAADAPYVTGVPGGTQGSIPPGAAIEDPQREIINVITAAGLTPDSNTLNQLAVAIQSGALISATASGTADALTASFTPAVTALVNGATLIIRASAANATATPTLSVNGLAAKTIVKGNNLPVVAGDIAGAGHWLELQYDSVLDKFVLQNPANGIITVPNDVGFISLFSGPTPPDGYLACPTAQTNISRTTYAALFAVLGTTWGAGDGITTFGMPWFPDDYTMLQAGVGAVGSGTIGENISHRHTVGVVSGGTGLASGAGWVYNSAGFSGYEGGPFNKAAGHRVKFCVKY